MTDALTIRRATPADGRAIAELHVRAWQWAYKGLVPDDYLARLGASLEDRVPRYVARLAAETEEDRTWLAEQDGRIVGFAITGPSRNDDAPARTGEVSSIYLEPDAVGTGVGRALFTHAVDDLKDRGYEQATLWVLATNARARRFYEAAGWQPDGATKIEERPGATFHEVRYRREL